MNKPLQILVAEDNRGDVFLIREALAKHGVAHELHVVRDGEEALRFIEASVTESLARMCSCWT